DLERLHRGRRLETEALLERHPDPLDRGAAVGEHRLLGEACEGLRYLQGSFEVLVGGHDLGEQADLQGLLCWYEPAGEDDVQGAAEAYQSRQPLGAAVDKRHAEAPLREAERRPLGR